MKKQCKEKVKRLTAAFLIFVLVLCNVVHMTTGYAYAKEAVQTAEVVSGPDDQDMNIKGTDSMGEMVADTLESKQEEQEENNGCNIFEVVMEGNVASVSFETTQNGSIVVAVYEEDGIKMLASGTTEVLAGDVEAKVTIDISSMPDYFYLRAFLVDTDSLRPLCTAYDSPNYTKEMQDFLSKTTDDFEADKVLNLDDDKTSNFAVYSDDTKVIRENDSTGHLISANEETNTYIFEDADDQISSLQAGDTFAYHYGDNDVLILKVADIQIDGSTVTIQGDDTELEEVFDYVKIEADAKTSEVTVDDSACEEGVIYNGMVKESEGGNVPVNNAVDDGMVEVTAEAPEINAVDITGSESVSLSFSFVEKKIGSDDNNVKLSGETEIKDEVSLKLYISLSRQYLELKMDYSMKLDITVSGEASGKIPLTTIAAMPVPGVLIEFTPSLILEVSGKIEISGTLEGTVGFSVSRGKGVKNLTSSPAFESGLEGEATVFVGISLEPQIAIISDNIAKVELEAKLGAEIKGTISPQEITSGSEIHTCKACVEGEISAKLEVTFEAKLLNSKRLKYEKKIKETAIKLFDFYYSLDHKKGGLKTCPYLKYKVGITVTDEQGIPLKDVKITAPFSVIINGDQLTDTAEIVTDNTGKATGYLVDGDYKLIVSKEGYVEKTEKVTIKKDSKSVVVKLEADSQGGETGDENIASGVSQNISLGFAHSGVITEDGSLYMWGCNADGQLGDGTREDKATSVKVMENVAVVSLGVYHSGAITKDGSLYMWGRNNYGQLGDGNWEDKTTPVKVMENVVAVSLGEYHSGAITKDGSLYMWGRNNYGQLGDETDEKKATPVKIMDNVKVVSLGGYHSGAITKDDSLYMWGRNNYGQLGDGTREDKATPVKIMDNVEEVSLGEYHSGAITPNGSLYMWGSDLYGELSDGSGGRKEPVKVMENIETVGLGYSDSGAITKDGVLYIWGHELYNLENGSEEQHKEDPVRIMENVEAFAVGCAHSGVVTKDGSLYMRGSNFFGQLGDGTWEDKRTPVKIMDNIKCSNTNTFLDTPINTVEVPIVNASPETMESDGNSLTYSDLIPDTSYTLYALKSRETENPLLSDNLLYIHQAVSDSEGNITFTYDLKESYESPEFVLKGKTGEDITKATFQVFDRCDTGEEQEADYTVTYQGKNLIQGEDYELGGDFAAAKQGEYTLTITGIGDYSGSLSKTYSVKPHAYVTQKVVEATCEKDGEKILTCTSCQNTVTEVLEKTGHKVGNWITDKAATVDSPGSKHKECTVCKEVIETETIPQISEVTLSADKYTYNGKIQTPKIVLKDSAGKDINADFYTISYPKGRKNVGKYTVTVTLKGDYQGTVKKNYTINPKGVKLSKVKSSAQSFTAKWKKNTKQVTGYQLQYSLNKKFASGKKYGTKTVTIKKNTSSSKKISKLKSGKKYYVRIRTYKKLGKATYYSEWSPAKKVTMKAAKK